MHTTPRTSFVCVIYQIEDHCKGIEMQQHFGMHWVLQSGAKMKTREVKTKFSKHNCVTVRQIKKILVFRVT